MQKNIYEHKETKKKVVTSEKLDSKHWKKINVIKSGQMESSKIHTKKHDK